MKLNKNHLMSAVAHVGFDFDRKAMRALLPIKDYDFDAPEYEGSIKLVLKDIKEWGTDCGVGLCVRPEQLGDVARALADAYYKGYSTLFIFVEK